MIQLTEEQYETLVALARKSDCDSCTLDAFLKDIERKNGIKRYFLGIRWQETNTVPPPKCRNNFPRQWPPELEATITKFDRPIARADVDKLLSASAKNPISIMVTEDPAMVTGWFKFEDFYK